MNPARSGALCLLAVWLSAAPLSAASLVPIPTPRDSQGDPVRIGGVGFHGADVLVLLDSTGSAYETRDTGRTWISISVPAGKELEFFGTMLQTTDGSRQYRDGQWRELAHPRPGVSCDGSWMTSGGYTGCVESATGDVIFHRSTDSLLTWQSWFRLPASTLEQFHLDEIDELGSDAGGRMWWLLQDSSALRGTSDGRTWIDVPVPPLGSVRPRYGIGDTLFVRGQNADGKWLGLTTTDWGRHWDSVPIGEPGGASLARTGPGKWFATARDPVTRVTTYYFGPTFRGPWERLPDSLRKVTVSTHGDVLMNAGNALAWIVPATSGAAAAPLLRSRTAFLRTGEAGWSVAWPAGAPAGAWKLVSADGRVLFAGVLAAGQRELALPASCRTGWLVLPDTEGPLAIPGGAKR